MAKVKFGKLVSDTLKKGKIGGESFAPSYSTGIDLLDYMNGRMEGSEVVKGVSGGKIVTVVGKSGSGKSTLAYQIAGMVLKSNPDAQVIHLDYERSANKARISMMSKVPIDEIFNGSDVWNYMNSNISSESLYKLVKAIYDIKMSNKDDITIEEEFNGAKVSYVVPTVLIVDSVAAMTPSDIIEEAELSGPMSASAIARSNNAIYKRISNFITDANIMIININHITQTIAMGVPKKPILNFLSMDESVPGGSSALFMADSLIKLDPGTKLDPEKDFGIKGFISNCQFIKSRSNSSGRKFNLVFDQEKGFDNLLTSIQYLKEAKLLLGSGHGYYIETMPDKKFKMKNVRELYDTDKEFRDGFDSYMKEVYYELLSGKFDGEIEEQFILEKLVDEEQGIWKANDGKYYIITNEESGECEEVEYNE